MVYLLQKFKEHMWLAISMIYRGLIKQARTFLFCIRTLKLHILYLYRKGYIDNIIYLTRATIDSMLHDQITIIVDTFCRGR